MGYSNHPDVHSYDLNPWKRVIDNELVNCWLGTTETYPDPYQALTQIIRFHTDVALNPDISAEAEALIERGRQEMKHLLYNGAIEPKRGHVRCESTTPSRYVCDIMENKIHKYD